MTADVVLHPGRERSVRRRHPWLLSGAINRVVGNPAPGDAVRVITSEGEVVAYGHFSPSSQIRVRCYSFGKDQPTTTWLSERITRAVKRRQSDPLLAKTNAVRLLNAEGDDVPALIVDQFDDVIVTRLSSVGMFVRREEITDALREATGARAGYERADAPAARREGVKPYQGILWGSVGGPVRIWENERSYLVDVIDGQKTGFYLDQRDARDRVQAVSRGRQVLDLFSYTGGFAVAAAKGAAKHVTLVESSSSALELARRNLELNQAKEFELIKDDVFEYLRKTEEKFDLLVIDPPPFARRQSDVYKASRAYKDLMLQALRHAAPDALVFTFRCSHAIGTELFRKLAFAACTDARRPAQVLTTLGLPVDHPVALTHPEGEYLSGLMLRV